MTREQIINLRAGRKVRVTHVPNRYLEIKAVRITHATQVFELEGGLIVTVGQILEVLPAAKAA